MKKLLINVFGPLVCSALSQKVSGLNVHWWNLSDKLKHVLKTKQDYKSCYHKLYSSK